MTYIKNKFHLVMLFFNKAAAEYAKRTKSFNRNLAANAARFLNCV